MIYELVVQSTLGPTLAGVTPIVTGTDILRNPTATDFLYNMIYLSTTSSIHLWNTLGADKVALFSMKDTNFLQTNFPVIAQSSTGPTDTSITPKTFAVYDNLAPGWYGARFTYTVGGDTGSASYQSYSYQCPYTLGITDIRGAFDPCAGTMPPAGDPINLHQQVAIQAHGCNPSNQWFDGTSCQDVDPTFNCNTFGPRTGKCQTCPN